MSAIPARDKKRENSKDLTKEKRGSLNPELDLKTIDEAIDFYIKEKINFEINSGTKKEKVLVYNRSLERAANSRNKNNKDMNKMVKYPRVSYFRKNDLNLYDGMMPLFNRGEDNSLYVKKPRYSEQRKYTFLLNGSEKVDREIYKVSQPDFVQLNYTLQISTKKQNHMNQLIQILRYYHEDHWGYIDNNSNKYRFRTRLGDITDDTEEESTDATLYEVEIPFTVYASLLPRFLGSKKISQKQYKANRVVINLEAKDKFLSEKDIRAARIEQNAVYTKLIQGLGGTVSSNILRWDAGNNQYIIVNPDTEQTDYVINISSSNSNALMTRENDSEKYNEELFEDWTVDGTIIATHAKGWVITLQSVPGAGTIINGSVNVQVNGLQQTSGLDQSVDYSKDFYIITASNQIILLDTANASSGFGNEFLSIDNITISYRYE